jgi:hypothetical protein
VGDGAGDEASRATGSLDQLVTGGAREGQYPGTIPELRQLHDAA